MIGSTSLSSVQANRLPKDDEDKKQAEYEALLAVFTRFIESYTNETDSQEILEELMNLRADFLIQHALSGFDIDYDEALEMLRNAEGLNDEQSAKRNIIVAAVDNLIDFAVAEEYQMARELPSFDDEEFDEDDYEEIFEKYNKRYAEVENSDVEYAMIIAAGLIGVADSTMLTYMTQGDERVRPWHLQYEGFTAPKSQFPAWLIPPIEHQCRCYLVEDNIVGMAKCVKNAVMKVPTMPDWFNRTFKESVVLGGRIFSDEHPYFTVDSRDEDSLRDIAKRIKEKYMNG